MVPAATPCRVSWSTMLLQPTSTMIPTSAPSAALTSRIQNETRTGPGTAAGSLDVVTPLTVVLPDLGPVHQVDRTGHGTQRDQTQQALRHVRRADRTAEQRPDRL